MFLRFFKSFLLLLVVIISGIFINQNIIIQEEKVTIPGKPITKLNKNFALIDPLPNYPVTEEKPTQEKIPDSTKTIAPLEEENKKTTLIFAGDLMLDRGVKRSIYRDFKGDYQIFLENLSFLKEADIAFANLEGNLSDQGQDRGKKYSFRMEPKALEAITEIGLDALSVANNHTADWGQKAFLDTIKRLKEKNIVPVGGDINKEEATRPKIIERNGLKIGFLGFTDVGPDWFSAQKNREGILLASDPDFEEIISQAKEETDFLITSFHWGEEYQKPNQRQKTLAHRAIEAGTDIVVGHHPHVIQKTVKYKDGLIIYSLGNLIFDQYFSEATMQGLIVKVTLEGKKISKINRKIIKLARNYQPTELINYSDDVLSLKAHPNQGKAPGSQSGCPKPNKIAENKREFNVNRENSLDDYVPENLVLLSQNITNGKIFCLETETSQALREMLKSAQSDSLILAVTSAYRSHQTQEDLLKQSLNKNDGDNSFIAPAKHSEHQLGTTVDLSGQSINFKKTILSFAASPEYLWLKNNAAQFGFVQSYPKDKEAITQYPAEPWHWRYVGNEIAQKLKESGETLTEYLNK